MGALSTATGAYRVANGPSSMPRGTIVTVTYRDGTSEKYIVVSTTGSVQAIPIAGTQKDKDGNLIETCDGTCSNPPSTPGGGNQNPPSSSGWGRFWNWVRDIMNGTRTGTVEVGPIKPV
jgi:hypothetical protein